MKRLGLDLIRPGPIHIPTKAQIAMIYTAFGLVVFFALVSSVGVLAQAIAGDDIPACM